MNLPRFACLALLLTAAVAAPVLAISGVRVGPEFPADATLGAAALDGTQRLGAARWSAKGDEIVADATRGGGVLLFEPTFANVSLYGELMLSAGAEAGLLMRAERTASGGLRSLLVTIGGSQAEAFLLELDAQGREVSRTPVAASETAGGLYPGLGNTPPEILEGIKRDGLIAPMPQGIDLPTLAAPDGAYRPGVWNGLNINLYNDMLRHLLNAGPAAGQAAVSVRGVPGEPGYGRIGLYARGRVRFRKVQYQDLQRRVMPAAFTSPRFRRIQLENLYTSWSVAVEDVNRDGKMDVIAGPYAYLGPDFTEAREIYTPAAYNPVAEYPQKSMLNIARDFTGDGWPDVLVMSGNAGYSTATLYENPKAENRNWPHRIVLKPIGNEETLLKDVDGDRVPELIHAYQHRMAYSRPAATGEWKVTTLSEKGPWGSFVGHGLGIGDIDGDGRADYLTVYGWWRQPVDAASATVWEFHPEAFGTTGNSQGGAGGAEMGVYDINGDGLNDVITVMEAHRFGIAWFEQQRGKNGTISFVKHDIMGMFGDKNAGDVTFSQPHAIGFADMNGDGVIDFVTGKRQFSHLYNYFDPDPLGAPVLYVYYGVRDPKAPGGARFEPELVDNRTGVGSHIQVTDIDGDGRPDIATAGAAGTFVFLNRTPPAGKGEQ